MLTPRGRFWLGSLACYGLAYATLIALAVRKDYGAPSVYSLLVWSASAALLSAVLAVCAWLMAAAWGRLRVKSGLFLTLWALFTFAVSIGLFVNAR